ncbi:MAG: GNAT family N-acetyltransferase [Actinomycetota bacterium]|nr:GNAT family N-acetyltransferase [Actinomycetota bacterium]
MNIRRIRDGEGDLVGHLWDRMCREIPDGGPLTDDGRRRIARMLDACAWHRDAFCLVATDDTDIVGFVNGRVDVEEGLLPGALGMIDSLYVVPEYRHAGVSTALARAAIAWLRQQGASTIRYLSCADATDDHRFWRSLGFVSDMVCLSSYQDE